MIHCSWCHVKPLLNFCPGREKNVVLSLSVQMYQSSPGGQSSCSSEPSPLGSATNNDSGVEMAAYSGGSLGDLTALDEQHYLESAGFEDSLSGVTTVGLNLCKQLGSSQHLERLKMEKLKTVRDSCQWARGPKLPTLCTKLPPIPTTGELTEWLGHKRVQKVLTGKK